MRLFRLLGPLILGAVAMTVGPSTAHAWTRTVVHSARAKVDVERNASVYVLLRLDVEVHAGWLHEIEITDLGPGVELDRYRPPYFRSEEGEVYRPEAELDEEGRIRLRFARREAPRRGEYKVFMRYRTPADVSEVEVDGKRRARVVWSLPAWETGLHGASVELRAPPGASVPDEMRDPPPGMRFELEERPKRTIVRWQRIHLPRMTAWPIALDLPADAIALPQRGSTTTPPVAGFQPLEPREDRPVAWALVMLTVLVWLKRRSVEMRFGRESLWVPIGWPTMLVASISVVLLVQWLAPAQPVWGFPLALLALCRRRGRGKDFARRQFKLGRPASRHRERPSNLLDATTAAGTVVLLACSVLLFALGQPEGTLLLAPIFLLETRIHRSPDASESVQTLRGFMDDLRLPIEAPAMSFRWECADGGAPRVRIHMPETRTGLLSISFTVTASPLGLVQKRDVSLVVETRAQSDADDVMRRRVGTKLEHRAVDGRVFRIVRWNPEALELLRVLGRKRPRPAKSSRGTWFLKEISEPRRRAA